MLQIGIMDQNPQLGHRKQEQPMHTWRGTKIKELGSIGVSDLEWGEKIQPKTIKETKRTNFK